MPYNEKDNLSSLILCFMSIFAFGRNHPSKIQCDFMKSQRIIRRRVNNRLWKRWMRTSSCILPVNRTVKQYCKRHFHCYKKSRFRWFLQSHELNTPKDKVENESNGCLSSLILFLKGLRMVVKYIRRESQLMLNSTQITQFELCFKSSVKY